MMTITVTDHRDYRDAIAGWARKAAASGKVISHVRFVGGHVQVTMIDKRHEPPPELEFVSRRGLLL